MIHPDEAVAIQRVVAERFGDPAGVADPDGLAWALARPFATNGGIPSYPTFFNKVSALFQGLLLRRPFAGANRRTAFCIAALLLKERGYRLVCEPKEVQTLVTGVEMGFTTYHRITVWIKKHAVREGRPAARATTR